MKLKPWGTGLLLPNIEVNHTDDETSTIRLVESLLMGASKFSPDTQGDGQRKCTDRQLDLENII